MKQRMQGMVTGFLAALLIVGGSVMVAAGAVSRNIEVFFGNYSVVINGTELIATDTAGNYIQPFAYNGNMYVPAEEIARALGMGVNWVQSTGTLYLGKMAPVETQVPLYSMPYIEVGDAANFIATGDDGDNQVLLQRKDLNGGNVARENHVVYQINFPASSFRATLAPSPDASITFEYRIFGDGRLLYTSPSIGSGSPLIPIDVNISGVSQLKIEITARNDRLYSHHTRSFNGFRGIENAVIVIPGN